MFFINNAERDISLTQFSSLKPDCREIVEELNSQSVFSSGMLKVEGLNIAFELSKPSS